MSEKSLLDRFDAAGWLFWFVVLAVFVGPCIYAVRLLAYAEASWPPIIGIGVFLAVVMAGLTTWIINTLLQQRQTKLRRAARKKAKKRK